ncbi:MAG: helix-turn-helix transcriptional regulator [Chloroflexi bacterium]|nr:helix-turn-helix transcriptional regulator [Chloroflexota bacterium]
MAKRQRLPKRERENAIGKYLTDLRVAQGKTQQDIADELHKSRYLVCRIEIGERTKKSLEGILLYDVAKAYRASIIEILKRAESVQLPLIMTGADVDNAKVDPLLDTTEEERQELIQYLKEIRQRKTEQPPK